MIPLRRLLPLRPITSAVVPATKVPIGSYLVPGPVRTFKFVVIVIEGLLDWMANVPLFYLARPVEAEPVLPR